MDISINNQDIRYRVVFDHEKYNFIPEAGGQFPSFSFSREEDVWKDRDAVSPQIKMQALEALDNYLLKQH